MEVDCGRRMPVRRRNGVVIVDRHRRVEGDAELVGRVVLTLGQPGHAVRGRDEDARAGVVLVRAGVEARADEVPLALLLDGEQAHIGVTVAVRDAVGDGERGCGGQQRRDRRQCDDQRDPPARRPAWCKGHVVLRWLVAGRPSRRPVEKRSRRGVARPLPHLYRRGASSARARSRRRAHRSGPPRGGGGPWCAGRDPRRSRPASRGAADAAGRPVGLRDVLGPDHYEVAATLDRLAASVQHTGDHAQAASLHERSLVIKRRILGPGHAEVAETASRLTACRAGAAARRPR